MALPEGEVAALLHSMHSPRCQELERTAAAELEGEGCRLVEVVGQVGTGVSGGVCSENTCLGAHRWMQDRLWRAGA